MENQFKVGQELSFNVYGNELKGTYVEMHNAQIVKIAITHDSSGVSELGSTAVVNLAFLVKDTLEEKNQKFTKEYADKLSNRVDINLGGYNKEWNKGFIEGYVQAVKETASPELLEALISINNELKHIAINDLSQAEKNILSICQNAINKSIK